MRVSVFIPQQKKPLFWRKKWKFIQLFWATRWHRLSSPPSTHLEMKLWKNRVAIKSELFLLIVALIQHYERILLLKNHFVHLLNNDISQFYKTFEIKNSKRNENFNCIRTRTAEQKHALSHYLKIILISVFFIRLFQNRY